MSWTCLLAYDCRGRALRLVSSICQWNIFMWTWLSGRFLCSDQALCSNCKATRQSWGWGLKNPLVWPSFFKYFQGKPKARHFCDFAPSYTIAIITRMHQASTCGWVWVPESRPWASGPNFKCSTTVEVGCSHSELKPSWRQIANDEI